MRKDLRGARPRGNARRGRDTAIAVLVVLLLAPVASIAAGAPVAPSAVPSGPSIAHGLAAQRSEAPRAERPTGAGPPPAGGPGTFFTNVTMPFASASGHGDCVGNASYPYYTVYNGCYNESVEPSIVALPVSNASSPADLALAYSTDTNETACPSLASRTTSAVAFTTSSNGGSTWSSPKYFGPTNCTSSNRHFPDAWQPSLAVLSNGTIAMAYVQLNLTADTYGYLTLIPSSNCEYVSYDRIVVTESYNGGSSWTTPVVVANGSNPSLSFPCATGALVMHPSLAAYGSDDLYLAYQNVGDPLDEYDNGYYGAGDVHFSASTDGGSTWSTPVLLRGIKGSYSTDDYKINLTTNPQVAVTPGGTVLVSYLTAINETSWSGDYDGPYVYLWNTTGDLYLATSSNNGSSFSYSKIGSVVIPPPEASNYGYGFGYPPSPYNYGQFGDPVLPIAAPIAFSPQDDGYAYMVYTSWQTGFYCTTPQYQYPYCDYGAMPMVYLRTSTNNGTSFGAPVAVAPQLLDPRNGSESLLDTPSVAVAANGTVYVQFGYANGSVCLGPPPTAYQTGPCAPRIEYLTWSTDHGASFATPIPMDLQGVTGTSIYGQVYDPWYYGEYSSLVASQGNVFAAYATEDCYGSANASYCGYGWYGTDGLGDLGEARMVVSHFYEGANVTLDFTETGLPSGARWSIAVDGNWRSGTAGTTLSVEGVPKSTYVNFDLPWTNISWGVAYVSSGAAGGTYAANSTVKVAFSEQLLVSLDANPPGNSAIFNGGTSGYYSTLTVSPSPPSAQWVTPGTSVTMSATWANATCQYCYVYNISFVSWTGSGAGAVSSNATSISVKATTGPINETINTEVLGLCYYYPPAYVIYDFCYDSDYALDFSESGLPSGTSWSVAIHDGNETHPVQRLTSTAATVAFTVPDTLVSYVAYAVPGSGGEIYEPSESVASPVLEPVLGAIPIRYTEVDPASENFSVNVTTLGLPSGARFDASLGPANATGTGWAATTVPGGTALALSAPPVLFENGTGYVAKSATLIPYETGAKWTNVTLPARIYVNATARLVLTYGVAERLTVQADAGGTVTPASEWVAYGAKVTLNATADAGYFFVGWEGSGSGASGPTQRYDDPLTVSPTGPVTEVATFRPIPPATWNVTFVAGGLAEGTPFSFRLGGASYSGAGSVKVGLLVSGDYSIWAGPLVSNSTNGTRYALATLQSSFGAPSNGELPIDANGTVWLNYSLQYALDVAASPHGSVDPSPGISWWTPGASVVLTASAGPLSRFVGWNGTGDGAVSSRAERISVVVDGPLSETAGFQRLPNPPPATFSLTLTESGLPSGLAWNVSVGTLGTSGASGALLVNGLNGSYPVDVPPVLVGSGQRWIANLSSGPSLVVTANRSVALTFSEQFLLAVAPSVGGTASGGGWYAPGSVVALTAAPAASMTFVGWTGSGAGAVNGSTPTISVTLTGPTSEIAGFVPSVAATTTGGGLTGVPDDLGLFVALAIAGLALGYLMFRPRRPPSAPEAAEDDPGAYETASWAEPAPDEYALPPPTPEPEWSEGPPGPSA